MIVVHRFGPMRTLRRTSGFVALAASCALALGWTAAPAEAATAYLVAFGFYCTIALGALFLLLICHAMRAGWPTMFRCLLEAMILPLPLLGVLFLPVLAAIRLLYPWVATTPGSAHATRVIAHKAPYLNVPFFAVRALVFFAAWIALGGLLVAWSRRQSEGLLPEAPRRFYLLSAVALPPTALTLVFASFDWFMSLTPLWVSSMYPVYVFAAGVLAATALLAVLAYALHREDLLGVQPSHYYAIGRLALAFTIVWAYAAFFQFFLIWMANKPDEAGYFTARLEGSWKAVSMLLPLGHFVVPFAFLLNYRVKRFGRPLAAISAWLLAFHYLDVHWLVAPAERRAPAAPYSWLDPVALLALGGTIVWFVTGRLRGRPIEPLHDPRLAEARAYESS